MLFENKVTKVNLVENTLQVYESFEKRSIFQVLTQIGLSAHYVQALDVF